MSYYIDAHCHLHKPWFKQNDIPQIVQTAKDANVNKIVNCASDPSQFNFILSNYIRDTLYVTLGMQPTLAAKFIYVDEIERLLNNDSTLKKIKAIGEVGLDYHWVKDRTLQKRQKRLFLNAVKLANNFNLPLVIHSRKAENDCLNILEQHAQTPVLLHSFEGNLDQINRSNDLDYLVSIPTNVVIRKGRRKVAKRVGLENILLETDSPYCAHSDDVFPNTPKNIPEAARKLSEIFDVSINEVRNKTTKNALRFYSL